MFETILRKLGLDQILDIFDNSVKDKENKLLYEENVENKFRRNIDEVLEIIKHIMNSINQFIATISGFGDYSIQLNDVVSSQNQVV